MNLLTRNTTCNNFKGKTYTGEYQQLQHCFQEAIYNANSFLREEEILFIQKQHGR